MKKRLIFLIALFFVSLVSFSSATFAWFTDQYNPSVDSLKFNVATQEYLMISKTGVAGSFKDNISFSELVSGDVTLKPVSAEVTENSISLMDGQNSAIANNNYIMFSLYFSSSNDMEVYLEGSSSGTVVDPIKIDNNIFTDEQVNKIVNSIRVGFIAYSTREVPTSSGIDIIYDPIDTHIYSVNEKIDSSYKDGLKPYETFYNIGRSEIVDDVVLLDVTSNKVSKMDIYIWLESEDVSCDESIFNSPLQINLRFKAVKIEEADN